MHKISPNDSPNVTPTVTPKKTRNEIKFTDVMISNLKPKSKRITYWCQGLDGFGIRVTSRGIKSWIYTYRVKTHPNPIKMTLGRYPEVSLKQARELYFTAYNKTKKGQHPAIEQKKAEQREKEALTVSELASLYIEYCQALGQKSWKEKQRGLKRDVVPVIGHLKAEDVTFRDISPLINNIFIERQSVEVAKHTLSYIKTMFKYAKNGLGVVELNPCADLDAPKKKKNKRPALDPKDIYLFWNNLENTTMTQVVQLGLKFMLCTMTRGIEVRTAKWSEINMSEGIWLIPEDKAKNNCAQLVPLNRRAMDILYEIRSITGNHEYVFSWCKVWNKSPHIASKELKPLSETAFSHALRDNLEKLAVSKKFTPHDLRRTGATRLTSVSYPKEWVKKQLNHSNQDVTDFYDVYDYFEEKRAGMELINYMIDQILASPSAEFVPSVKTLRKQVLTKGLIHEFMKESYYTKSHIKTDKQTGYQANFSTPVSYTLSCDLVM